MRVCYGEAPDFRHRLIEDVGELFLVGVAGGSAFHFVRGFRNSPNGCRLVGGAHAVRTNAPRVGGACAAYSAVFCGFEKAMSLARQREDYWNSIAAGAASSGLTSVRRGLSAVACSALYGGTIFAVVAGVCWTIEQCHTHIMSFRDTRMSRDLQAPVATADGGRGCCRLPRRVQDQKVLPWLDTTFGRASPLASPGPKQLLRDMGAKNFWLTTLASLKMAGARGAKNKNSFTGFLGAVLNPEKQKHIQIRPKSSGMKRKFVTSQGRGGRWKLIVGSEYSDLLERLIKMK